MEDFMSLQFFTDENKKKIEYFYSLCYNAQGFVDIREHFEKNKFINEETKIQKFKEFVKEPNVQSKLNEIGIYIDVNDYFISKDLLKNNDFLKIINDYTFIEKSIEIELGKLIEKSEFEHFNFNFKKIKNYCKKFNNFKKSLKYIILLEEMYEDYEHNFKSREFLENVQYNLITLTFPERTFEKKVDLNSHEQNNIENGLGILVKLMDLFSEQLYEVYMNTPSFKNQLNSYKNKLIELDNITDSIVEDSSDDFVNSPPIIQWDRKEPEFIELCYLLFISGSTKLDLKKSQRPGKGFEHFVRKMALIFNVKITSKISNKTLEIRGRADKFKNINEWIKLAEINIDKGDYTT